MLAPPEGQIPGRGRVNLPALLGALRAAGYDGFLDLEIIGAQGWPAVRQMGIIAEGRGYLHRLLRAGGYAVSQGAWRIAGGAPAAPSGGGAPRAKAADLPRGASRGESTEHPAVPDGSSSCGAQRQTAIW